MGGKKVSVVIPVYDEGNNIPPLLDELHSVLGPLPYESEILVVDDGSSPETVGILDELCTRFPDVGVVHLSRNFGHQAALTAGIDRALGDAVIVMDGDGQHPPSLIPELIRRWEEGFQVVYTIRQDPAGLSPFKRLTSLVYYRLLHWLSDVHVPENTADFRLVDRAVAVEFRKLREHHRFLRGLAMWLGFSRVGVPYAAAQRRHGTTKYSLPKMIRLAVDGIVSMGQAPLRLLFPCGCLLCAIPLAYLGHGLIRWSTGGGAPGGWSAVAMTVLFVGGIQILALGVLGLYIGRTYEEAKNRPLYVVKDLRGFLARRDGGAQ